MMYLFDSMKCLGFFVSIWKKNFFFLIAFFNYNPRNPERHLKLVSFCSGESSIVYVPVMLNSFQVTPYTSVGKRSHRAQQNCFV